MPLLEVKQDVRDAAVIVSAGAIDSGTGYPHHPPRCGLDAASDHPTRVL